MSRTKIIVAAAVLGASLLCADARAAEVRFDPSVVLRVGQDGNVQNVGCKDEDDPNPVDPNVSCKNVSDETARLQLNLVMTAITSSISTWTLAFRPYREVYNEFSDRDSTGLNGSIEYNRVAPEASSLLATVSFLRTYRNEFNALDPEASVTFTPNSKIDTATVRLDGSTRMGRRSSFDWGVAARARSQDDTQLEDDQGTSFDDSTSGEVSVGFSYDNTPRSTIGGAYIFQGAWFERAEPTTAHGVAFTHDLQVGRIGHLSYRLGAFRATTEDITTTEPIVNASYRWETGPLSSFSIGVRQGLSEGDGRGGATLDRGGYLHWIYARPRKIGLGATLSYWDREKLEGTEAADNPPTALTVSENVSLPVGDYLRFGLSHSYRRQTETGEFDTSYHSFSVFMRWAIFGERRTG